MRIDKFLKNSRLIKRRTIAKEMCEQGRVQIGGRPAKPGSEIGTGDIIGIRFGSVELIIRVVAIHDTVKKEDADSMYELIERVEIGESDDE